MTLPRTLSLCLCGFAFNAVLFAPAGLTAQTKTAVTTYHYDNYRTGWNQEEPALTPASVASTSFGVLQTITLDDEVDAQPLVVPNLNITAGPKGKHDVVFAATAGNTIYAIDSSTGAILLSPNFGTPVPYPLGCTNNGP